jgi:hypothetical protein
VKVDDEGSDLRRGILRAGGSGGQHEKEDERRAFDRQMTK